MGIYTFIPQCLGLLQCISSLTLQACPTVAPTTPTPQGQKMSPMSSEGHEQSFREAKDIGWGTERLCHKSQSPIHKRAVYSLLKRQYSLLKDPLFALQDLFAFKVK